MFRKILPLFSACLCLLVFTGCARYDGDYKLPGVYRPYIQQGNVMDQDMFDRLKSGMNKNQVRFILGTPAINDPFHEDRWDYIYTSSENGSRRKQIHITLYFEDDKLSFLEGDVISSLRRPTEELKQPAKIVDVPDSKSRRRSLVDRVIDALPVVGDDGPRKRTPDRSEEDTQDEDEQETGDES